MPAHLSEEPIITQNQIATRIQELGNAISRDCGGADLIVIVILKGAIFFASDLIRNIATCVQIEFMRAKSYSGKESIGNVRFLDLPDITLSGKHILVVEDILDTGRTASAILSHIAMQNPASIKIATLLDKPSRRLTPIQADYVGFEIEDRFVIGYGLDYEEQYRELPAIYVLETTD